MQQQKQLRIPVMEAVAKITRSVNNVLTSSGAQRKSNTQLVSWSCTISFCCGTKPTLDYPILKMLNDFNHSVREAAISCIEVSTTHAVIDRMVVYLKLHPLISIKYRLDLCILHTVRVDTTWLHINM